MSWAAIAVGVIGAGVSAYGAHKAAKAQNKAANQQGKLTGMQTDAVNKLMPWGTNLMERGGSALTSLLPWYTKAAFGDRSTVGQLMRPELNQIRAGYDRPLQQITELTPRSGTNAASNLALLSGRGEAQSNALLGARAEGRAGLGAIGSQLAGLGSGAVGAAFGGMQGASSSNLGLMLQLYNLRQQNSADSAGVGSNLVDILRAYQQWRASRPPATGGPPPATGGVWV